MNKNFLEHYMKTKPETTEQKYLFLVDNQDIAYALIYAGYPVIFLINRQDAYHSVDSFIEYMDEIACTGTYINNQPSHWINFQNGYFDAMEWKLIEHDTKYLMIKGKGGTGKSIAISFIQHIVGINNYSSMSLQNLNQRFYPTGLFGKLLNACADIPGTAMESVDIIKKAVGEDTLLYEKKGQDPTQFNSYAKLLFSANEMPLNLDDKTNAYYRRLLVLDINRTIPEEQKDSQLKEKMCQESDYAIHMAMLALKQLYADNHFAESNHSKECIANLYRSDDSVKAFTDDMLCHKVGEKMKRSDVYKMYEDYCEYNGRTPHGKSRFWEYMSDKGFVIKRFPDGAYYFKDTSVKESDFEAIDDTIANPFEQMDLSLS